MFLLTWVKYLWFTGPREKNAQWCVWLTFLSALSNRKKKMYKTSEMIFYLIAWELLIHADPNLALSAVGKPSGNTAPQSMRYFHLCWWGSKCEHWGLREWVTGASSCWQGTWLVAIVSAWGKLQCLELAISQDCGKDRFLSGGSER